MTIEEPAREEKVMSAACQDYWINPRIRIAALWTSMLFVFAYVDLFSLCRADVRASSGVGPS